MIPPKPWEQPPLPPQPNLTRGVLGGDGWHGHPRGRAPPQARRGDYTKMHINIDKRPEYFFLKGIFQGVHNWGQGGARKKIRRICAPPWAEPPVRP